MDQMSKENRRKQLDYDFGPAMHPAPILFGFCAIIALALIGWGLSMVVGPFQ
jgi:hypothetical protein